MSIRTSPVVKKSVSVAVIREATLDRTAVVNNLTSLRVELEEGAMTKAQLSKVNVSAGYLLQDVCSALGLTEAETRAILGKHFKSVE